MSLPERTAAPPPAGSAGTRAVVARALAEAIEREKERAQKRIQELEREYAREMEALDRHSLLLREVNAAAAKVRDRIRAQSAEAAFRARDALRRAAGQLAEDCGKLGQLEAGLRELLGRAEEETRKLKRAVHERYGVDLTFPEEAPAPGASEHAGALRELEDWRSRLEALAAEDREARPAAPAASAAGPGRKTEQASPGASPIAAVELEELVLPAPSPFTPFAETGAGHGNGNGDGEAREDPADAVPRFVFPSSAEHRPEPDEEDDEGGPADEVRNPDLELLDPYQRTERNANGAEFHVFGSNGRVVLDLESMLAQIDRSLRAAALLHERLKDATTAKEQFVLKRGILNRQDSLKAFLAAVAAYCERKPCLIPVPQAGPETLETVHELARGLEVSNWSDPAEMAAYEKRIRAAAREWSRAVAGRTYPRAVLAMLGQA